MGNNSIIKVTNNNDSGAGSLRDAITQAQADDTITFASNLANETIRLTSGQLNINKNLTIEGIGAANLTISGNNAGSVFQVQASNVIFRNLIIVDGDINNGDEIDAESGIATNLTFDNCKFNNNVNISTNGTVNIIGESITIQDGFSITSGEININTNSGIIVNTNGSSITGSSITGGGGNIVINAGILSISNINRFFKNPNNDVFTIQSSNKLKLQINLTGRSSNFVNELGVFTVDDVEGRINGIPPGATGYTQAAIDRARVIFSSIVNHPNGFNLNNLDRILEFNSGDNLRFFIVKNSSFDAVKNGIASIKNILFSDPSNQKITDLGTDGFALAWKDGSGNIVNEFRDLVIQIQSTNQPLLLGTNLQEKLQGEVIDLRKITGQVKADFVVNREAVHNNFVGFYQVINENGGIDTNGDGNADILPGQAGYIQAAISRRVAGIELTVNNQQTAQFNGTFQPGSIFAPFIIVNNTPEAVIDSNNPEVYFSYLAANPDKVDHIRLLGNNVFGFEDLPNGGDQDFNDIIVQTQLTLV